jgi:hypothetical protein
MVEVELARLESQFLTLPDSDAIYTRWRNLVLRYGVTGFRAYDAPLVAVMLVHGISHLLTFNVDDFRCYEAITVVHPATLST